MLFYLGLFAMGLLGFQWLRESMLKKNRRRAEYRRQRRSLWFSDESDE